ncbi:6-phosphogluconolactonase [Buchnera aphidicola (Aphis craccivora)]|uniref:6-phosphogluconolactonase n=1 Tax=Buchnera aphidicola (Aphis craccivora) TaxID=466616 RepID=A0A4D6XNJ9_9GAMM|nr:6-phosphogluconolactonase [Buchnera aphidicola]QCI16538.1 6-phosphogluconolactonase [Buchnera aphidicola (Aphis craccivora)]QLL40672.1 6-phosphogluconolactonase [Buchnera aphidicola (Aphis craccivore)]WAI17511.1 MAG: 6-phosphogluconolactonase [Buchnera aphidicola (Aphis craccivora)]
MKQIIYIANSTGQNIEAWNLYQDGNMKLIHKVITHSQVQPINYIKNKSLLYAGVRPDNRIFVYSIKENGHLEKKGESRIPGSPNYISFSSDKKFLFCSSYHDNSISVIPLNENGIPKEPIQIIYNINGCHAALFNAKYNILFVTSLKEDCIYLYHLTKHGILKNTEQKLIQTKFSAGPRHIRFHPNEDFVYTINELNGTIDVWEIYIQKNIQKVKNIQNISIVENYIASNKYWSADIHITSCGNFLYASDRILNSISLFYINKNNGKLSFIKIYPTEIQPRTFCIDINNKYVIVAGQKSNKFTVYSIHEKTGYLKKLNTYSTGEEPLWTLACTI